MILGISFLTSGQIPSPAKTLLGATISISGTFASSSTLAILELLFRRKGYSRRIQAFS